MGFITKSIFRILSNALALIAAAYFVPGFILSGDILNIMIVGVVLTLINLVIKPFLKLFFGPFILLSLGLFLVVINALTLIILDFFSPNLTIQGYLPLLYGTIIVSVVNMILSLVGKTFSKNE